MAVPAAAAVGLLPSDHRASHTLPAAALAAAAVFDNIARYISEIGLETGRFVVVAVASISVAVWDSFWPVS